MPNSKTTSNGVKIPLDQQNIINVLGIASLPDERKAQFVDKASELVQKRLLLRTLDSLDESSRQQFGKLLDKNDQVALQEFLAAKVPNLPEMMVEETNKMKQEFADLTAKVE